MTPSIKDMTKAEKLEVALAEMKQGKTREEVAALLGYTTYRSLDNVFRLAGYTYDKASKKYLPNHEQPVTISKKTKADEVRALFAKHQWNAKEIAEKTGFENARALATYMSSKGYKWQAKSNNYESDGTEPSSPVSTVSADYADTDNQQVEKEMMSNEVGLNQYENYLPLLQYLEANKEKLMAVIQAPSQFSESGELPRYTIPGVSVTKSVHMSNQLDQMVRDYSSEKNIAQRDIFVIALVRFFKAFGYEREIQALLEQ
jgi:hypothetical protein